MRNSLLISTLCTSFMLAACSQPEKMSLVRVADSSFDYNEQDFIAADVPFPKPGVNQRPVVGVKKALVSVIHWRDGDTLDKTMIEKHTLSSDPDSLRSYILAASLGKLTLDGQVISFVSGPRPDLCKSGAPYPMSLATAEGAKAAQANGLNPSSFDYLINVIDCGGGASAYVPGRIMGVYGQAGSPHVYKHEFGHNLGYAHGQTYIRCPIAGDRIDAPTGCTIRGYGDTGDSVSGGGTLYPAINRYYSGWLDTSQAVVINRSGFYRLGVLGSSDNTYPQLYMINRTNRPSQLTLEYRKPTRFDNFPPTDNRVNGVWMRYASMPASLYNTQLDATPETASTADPALSSSGRFIYDSAARMSVRVCTTTPTFAEVAVSIDSLQAPTCIRPSTNN